MCPDYMRQNRCIFGEDCQYAHSQAEIRQLPKHELCSKYLGGATCLRSSEVFACTVLFYQILLEQGCPTFSEQGPLCKIQLEPGATASVLFKLGYFKSLRSSNNYCMYCTHGYVYCNQKKMYIYAYKVYMFIFTHLNQVYQG